MVQGAAGDVKNSLQSTSPKTDPRQILTTFEYLGSVQSIKKEYQVFSTSRGDYLVFSPSNRSPSSLHVTHVLGSRVNLVKEIVSKSVTSNSLMNDKRVREAFQIEDPTVLRFEILATLYVMSALGAVEIDKSGRHLLFTPKRDPTS